MSNTPTYMYLRFRIFIVVFMTPQNIKRRSTLEQKLNRKMLYDQGVQIRCGSSGSPIFADKLLTFISFRRMTF